jgi:predicted enzyme related to lactoylglutathione lyase
MRALSVPYGLRRRLARMSMGGSLARTSRRVGGVMHIHHTIDYIEFVVRDLAAAKHFYAQAFGWRFTDYGPGYAGIHGVDGEVGGLRQSNEVVRGGPLVVLYSTDLGTSLDAVRSAGGSIVQEPFEFPGGRRFHFLDPSGNELAVWSPA